MSQAGAAAVKEIVFLVVQQLHVERAAIGEVSGDDKNGGTS